MASDAGTGDQTDLTKLEREKDGSFKRQASSFRDTIVKGGKFGPESGRYHIYASFGCPWAHRTLIVRQVKGLGDIISVSIVSPRMDKDGWKFANIDPFPGTDVDTLNHADHIKDIYLKADPEYNARYTVPILWDKKLQTIVNNESSEIIRILNASFNDLLPPEKSSIDLYPEKHRIEIDSLNEWVYDGINNGVYKAGFAGTQEAYEKAVTQVFASLDRVEPLFEGKDFLIGNQLTEADVRLYTTAVRFDVAYHGIFKCNLRTIREGYPNIHRWLRQLYWKNPAFNSTTNFDHIKTGYHSIRTINPNLIVPIGPIPSIEPL
ncbi:glutathione S-transferase [Fomitiporia mediterranea MF3/22]|uniref:Glutathione S-transferase n=1 Tax=Fomitiporia mediterranea (strain MF3/22) TaxID=694068 RepID=R7SHD7_FOMME|nr:glutathione S-transferase [Fomitiporia mediterranea MF3/22]EJC97697.1 glutathione S-transferase [Fomitiporia mediterranea MF3/22]